MNSSLIAVTGDVHHQIGQADIVQGIPETSAFTERYSPA